MTLAKCTLWYVCKGGLVRPNPFFLEWELSHPYETGNNWRPLFLCVREFDATRLPFTKPYPPHAQTPPSR